MKLIRNRTRKPVKVPLAGGHVLHLGPAKTGQVSDDALERPAFRRLVEQGEIEVVDEAGNDEAPQGPRVVHESTRGHTQRKVVLPSGNRPGGGKGQRGS